MSGVTDLDELLKSMEPELADGSFVYACVAEDEIASHLFRKPIGLFKEAEGVTLIVPAIAAEGLVASPPMRMITLTVHSSLEAVGLTGAFAAALTREGISANVVAAYHHDHIFVPERDAGRALEALRALSRSAREKGEGR
ncbi:ACT domain-containing protein [Shinella sp. CPCC 101442]|uniref:ACT domain-containing protein n=1 Tax=Shinella sp. CPCC 101442 TaxID=2932265 RepID=UPI002153878B|nr:ACT domain-containing protein [Shinella sp. CPCC 101442]MCR6500025.1 ACT domain-containing protein [Shinella sp. CPCC 101442]